jgi:hypothetical protein
MQRIVQPELLDRLPPDDPGAIGSRRDLHRLNACMGNAKIMARALIHLFSRRLAFRMAEIGAGDGEFLLNVARRARGKWRRVEALLVDQQQIVGGKTHAGFGSLSWRVESLKSDVFRWLPGAQNVEAIVANLFLHHFTDTQLRELFRDAAKKSQVLIAVEPRRAPLPFFCSRWVSLIGCCAVTRHDAPVSVRAGFTGSELSALWPDRDNWDLTEQRVGFFSHVFIAQKRSGILTGKTADRTFASA